MTRPEGAATAPDTRLDAAAAALLGAYATREPIAPLTETYDGLTVDDAYAIQDRQIASWQADGRRIVGYKIGLTSEAMQRQLGVDQPDCGFILEGMVYAEDEPVDVGTLIAPKVEPEIAVVLGKDLTGPDVTPADVEDAIDSVVGAIELIDSRIEGWRIKLVDTIADNASSAGLVTGATRLPLADVDIVGLGVTMRRGDEVVGEGTGAAVLGSPINAIVWLANRLGRYGVTLKAGSVVLPGSVCAAVPVAAGDTITADFGPLGSVSIAFEAKE